MFTFTPLLGALSESTASQSLLEFDGGVKILVDVGWDESFNVELLKELEKHVPTLSLILLTHATVPHIAAYAHCCKHIPLFTRIPVYATQPVINLGRTLTQELYSATPLAATTIPQTSLNEVAYAYPQASLAGSNLLLQPPTSEEIGKYFSLIQALKYSQPHQPIPSPFSPPLNGLTITAYNSGHTLGGTIWQIQHGLESIVYAVDWNQARENVFSGAAWVGSRAGAGGTEVIEQLRKPTALICSSRTPEAPLARSKRDEQLLESIKLCISRGGTVLIPTDSSARILELAYLLDHAWSAETEKGNEVFKNTKLYLCGRTVHSTIKYAESSLEWMDESMVREFEAVADGLKRANGEADGTKKGPFAFKHMKSLERKAQIDHVLKEAAEDSEPRGRVILASDSSLEWGFSKDVLQAIASDPRNLVILTEKPSLGANNKPSLARILWEWWKERRDGVATEQTSSGDTFEQVYGGGRELNISITKRQALEGNELTVYQQWLATQRQLHAALQSGAGAELEASADVVDDASSETSSESEGSVTQQQGKALNVSTTLAQAGRKKVVLKDEDLGITILLKKKGVYDFDVRGKKGRERMFPIAIRRKRNDEFGEVIRPEEYLRAEEREEADGQDDGQLGNKFEQGLGKKRKWEDVAASGKGGSGPNKRSQTNRNSSATGEPDTEALANGGAETDVLDTLEDEVEDILGPSKLVVSSETVAVRLRIAAVDFSGLHDKRSLNMLIPLIQPRKLILVAGSEDETLSLASDCRKLLSAKLGASQEQGIDVFTPAAGTTVDASVDTNAWVVKLADPLVKRLKWQNLRGMGIVTVTGVLQPGGGVVLTEEGEDAAHNKRLKIEDAKESSSSAITVLGSNSSTPASIPTLDVIPTNLVSSVRSAAQPLHVGDLRLADLRKVMQTAGHKAEFRGEGVLVIDDCVKVRKSGTGRVELESVALPVDVTGAGAGPGALSTMSGIMASSAAGGTFYAVKRKIYEGLAVVAGA
ncbi:cleavage factor two protein 2 [Naviculisporaceae sp. PSN 640]